MRKLILAMLAMPFAANAAPITYDVFDDIGAATISGTITTDGSVGALTSANIVDWNLTLSDGSISSMLTTANSFLWESAPSLSATLDELLWDYSSGNWFLFYENNRVGFWCLEGPNNGCAGYPSTSNISINNNGRRVSYVSDIRAGTMAIGTTTSAVSEPGMLTLFGLGLAGIGLARRRKTA